ncbi:hypothetical protein BDV93DRAFT_442658 [Ceratobasidium sp. AG-I]|nr:hypothetical protein BDV93DRAFT_442658 [Ceratobasidium sp. AG-I]
MLEYSAAKDKSAFPPAPGPGSLVPNAAQHFNLYTPRFVRGVGAGKVGLCAICVEPVWRGGEGKSALFNTKPSIDYHMQYNHGISSRTGLPFSPPIRFRKTKRPVSHVKPLERAKIEEGKCHACQKWVAIESVKTAEVLVPELYWWKHAASCHSVNHFAGDKDPYFEDHVYLRLREYEASIRGDPKLEDAPNSSDSADNGFKPSTSKCSGLNAESQPASQLDETLNPKGLSLGSGSLAPFVQTTSLSESANGPGRFFFMDSDSDLTDLEEDENGEIVDMDISEGENM